MVRSISFDVLAADKANKVLEQVAREVTELEKKLDGAGGTIEVDADTGKAREQIAAVDAQLARLNAKSLKIDADVAGARRDLQLLEAEAKRATGDRKVTVDADITAAQAKLRALEAAKVAVDVETGAAQAKLAAIERSLSKVDGDRATAKVDVDAAGALGRLAQVGAQLRAVQTPVTIVIGVAGAMEALAWIGSVAAGLAGLGAAGLGAGGVTSVALSGIGDAVTELGKKTEATGGKVSSSGASMRSAIRAVEAAQRDLRSANEDVVRSEEDLADAQDDARRAVEALDDARKDATRTLEDYALRSADMSLRQERASIGVAEAQQRLNDVNKDSKSTSLERAAAELAVREALQRQNELTVDAKRLTEDKTSADAKGVEQSDQVVAAQDRIKDANKRVEEAQVGITKAHEQVALAAQRVSDAQLAVREASQAAGSAGSAAADKQREAFEKLTPEGQRFALFLRALVDGPLKELQDTAQAGVLPGLQSGIEGFMANLGDAQGRIKSIAEQTGQFFDDIGPAAGRAAQALLRLADLGAQASFDNLAGSITGLLDRFTEWANSQSAEDIAQDVREIGETVVLVYDVVMGAVRGMQLVWEALKISTTGAWFREPLESGEKMYEVTKKFADHIPGLKGQLPELTAHLSDLDAATSGAGGATDRLDGSSRRLAGTQRDLESATRAAKDEMLRGEEASLRYAETLGRTESAARANGQAWSLGTEQGRGNRQALLDLIRTSNDTITSLEGQGASVDQVRAKYEAQRAKLIEVATQMTGSRTKAQEYIDKLLQVPADKTTNVKANTAQAMAGIGAVATGLANLRDKTVSVLTRYTSITATGTATSRSMGGRIPGAPSSVDTVPALLAQGEYVVRASSAQQWGPLLEVINGGGSPAQVSAALGPYAGATSVPVQRGSGGGGGTVVVQAPNMVVGQEDAVIRWVVAALGVAKDRGLLPPSFTVAAAG